MQEGFALAMLTTRERLAVLTTRARLVAVF
jgi:hypothetical protein